jgi:hypothetical protein
MERILPGLSRIIARRAAGRMFGADVCGRQGAVEVDEGRSPRLDLKAVEYESR